MSERTVIDAVAVILIFLPAFATGVMCGMLMRPKPKSGNIPPPKKLWR